VYKERKREGERERKGEIPKKKRLLLTPSKNKKFLSVE
jgi:hypothetical protein